ncbi:MAG: RHS repeat-associated core domain-containing protein [Gemmatimonadaceae bacterium]
MGSIIEGKVDPSGLIYDRNRYYDPTAGRFTQEDPIGIGGGRQSLRLRRWRPGQLVRSVWAVPAEG